MKSRWLPVSAMVVMACLALAGAAVQPSVSAPAEDPWIGVSTISSEAPADRKPCTYFNPQCDGAEQGQHCGPLPSSNCVCDVRPSGNRCVSGG